jgi:hypothetical protein
VPRRQHRSNRVFRPEQREYRERHNRANISRPGEHSVVRRCARCDPRHVGDAVVESFAIPGGVDTRGERRDVAARHQRHRLPIDAGRRTLGGNQ